MKHISLSALTALVLSISPASRAAAEPLVERGQHAILTVSLAVEGSVEKPQGYRDSVVKWSTKRALQAKVEMIAEKAETMSISGNFGAPGGPSKTGLEDIQKQAAACGNDQMCQMRVAMQMMNSPAMQGITNAPPRYQSWRPAPKGGRLEASGSHTDSLHTVFYTGARETTDCTLTAPKVSPELIKMDPGSNEKWTAFNQQALEDSARSMLFEVDGADKIGVLAFVSPLSLGYGDIECVQNIGSGPETSHHSENPTIFPTGDVTFPVKASGAVTAGDVISSGSTTLKITQKLNHLGVGFATDVSAPLDVTVRWELKKLS